MRQACQLGASGRLLAIDFELALTARLGGDAMEQGPQQVLDAARAQFCQRHLDRPFAAQHGVASGQENPRVINAVPHGLCKGDCTRQTFDQLCFLRLQVLTSSVARRQGLVAGIDITAASLSRLAGRSQVPSTPPS